MTLPPSGSGRSPRHEINGAQAIYGGVDGDTTGQITYAQAAGKFVILTPGAGGQGGGRGAGNAAGFNFTVGGSGNAAVPPPAGCPTPAGGPGGGGGSGGRGGRGGATGPATLSAEASARFADASAIALVDLDGLSAAVRDTLSNPLTATAVGGGGRGGRGGRGGGADPAALALAAVPTPNLAFQANRRRCGDDQRSWRDRGDS